jgi:hemerythrin
MMDYTPQQYAHMVDSTLSYLLEAEIHESRIMKHIGIDHPSYKEHKELHDAILSAIGKCGDIWENVKEIDAIYT